MDFIKDFYNFKEYAQQIAETIATILECDITIVDDKCIRIAGTGDYYKEVGIKLNKINNFYTVIKEKKKCIITTKNMSILDPDYMNIDNPTKDEEVSILIPIIVNDEALAAIGLSAITENKMKQIINNYGKYSTFMEKMSELLASKLKSNLMAKEVDVLKSSLNGIIDTFPDSIICIDINKHITFINRSAQLMFGLSESSIIHKPYSETFECLAIDKAIDKLITLETVPCAISVKNKVISVLADTRIIEQNNIAIGVVVLLQQADKIKNSYNAITNNIAFTINHIIGNSIAIETTKKLITTVANSSSTVLLQGESGTGKELCAKAIHAESSRKNEPFIAINCSAIPETLLESELFGYEAGTFTGASKNGSKGKFEFAQKGTMFLDEIGDMPISLQAKILRVLQEKTVTRLGGSNSIDLDIRIIAATNKNLPELVEKNLFREDLYYRINVIPIKIPTLRDRGNDLTLLANHFLEKYSGYLNKKIDSFSKDVLLKLYNYDWPGNIRELENVIEFAVNMETKNIIHIESLPESISTGKTNILINLNEQNSINKINMYNSTDNFERDKIEKLLSIYGKSTQGKKQVAEKLGIGIATLYRKIKKLNI